MEITSVMTCWASLSQVLSQRDQVSFTDPHLAQAHGPQEKKGLVKVTSVGTKQGWAGGRKRLEMATDPASHSILSGLHTVCLVEGRKGVFVRKEFQFITRASDEASWLSL